MSPHKRKRARSRSESFSLSGHPAVIRDSLVQAAQDMAHAGSSSPHPPRKSQKGRSRSQPPLDERDEHESTAAVTTPQTKATQLSDGADTADERTPLLRSDSRGSGASSHDETVSPPSVAGAHGHAHGSMNMRAILLHVFGDALGNVGVIATGLVIWQTNWSFKFYFDPLISLVITIIIFSSALPLGACQLTLQRVPRTF